MHVSCNANVAYNVQDSTLACRRRSHLVGSPQVAPGRLPCAFRMARNELSPRKHCTHSTRTGLQCPIQLRPPPGKGLAIASQRLRGRAAADLSCTLYATCALHDTCMAG